MRSPHPRRHDTSVKNTSFTRKLSAIYKMLNYFSVDLTLRRFHFALVLFFKLISANLILSCRYGATESLVEVAVKNFLGEIGC